MYVHCDVSEEQDWDTARDRTIDRFGKLDILVNNAAVLKVKPFEQTLTSDYLHSFKVNELGVFLGVRTAIAPMRAAGGGSIVNISTVDAVRPSATTVCYSATKYAVEGITRVAALELRRFNIRVNNVICGFAASEDLLVDAGLDPQVVHAHSEGGEALFGMPAVEGQLAGVRTVVFLASPESRSMTGANLVADFGLTAGLAILPAS
jgi:3alpha(or 20beta)-hydroxysteroid dehydrogenase